MVFAIVICHVTGVRVSKDTRVLKVLLLLMIMISDNYSGITGVIDFGVLSLMSLESKGNSHKIQYTSLLLNPALPPPFRRVACAWAGQLLYQKAALCCPTTSQEPLCVASHSTTSIRNILPRSHQPFPPPPSPPPQTVSEYYVHVKGTEILEMNLAYVLFIYKLCFTQKRD